MKKVTKPKRITAGRSVSGGEERTLPRLLEMKEDGFEIQADFWREIIHVTSPKLSKDMTFGATLKTQTKTTKNPVVTVWIKSLEELCDKRRQAEIVQCIKAALNKSGYSVNFK